MNANHKKRALKVLGTNLKSAREAKGWTQQILAKILGISVAYVSLIERGGRNPPATTIVEMAVVLGVDPGDLLGKAA